MKRSGIIRIIEYFLLCCVLLLSIAACRSTDPATPPADPPSEDAPPEGTPSEDPAYTRLFDFKGEPYYIRYESNAPLSSCHVSDIIINPDYTEDFTIVIPATSPLGIVTKIDIDGFSRPDVPDNVPCAMTRADFEALLDCLTENVADTERFLSYYECYDLVNAKSEKSRNVMLTEHPLVAYCADGYYALRYVSREDMSWLSDCLTKANFDAEDCAAAEYDVIKTYVEHEAFAPQYYDSILRDFYDRGAEHIVGIVLPETVSEIVGDPFADCTAVKNTTIEGKPDRFTRDYGEHVQLIAAHPKKESYIPFEQINAAGEFTYQWFYTASEQRMSCCYGLTLQNGANVELIVNDSYRIYAEKTHVKLPEGQTDLRTLDIRWYDAIGSTDYEVYPLWYSNPEVAIVFDSEDESGWTNGLEYHYEYIDGEFKLEFIVFPVGEYQFVWSVNADTLPHGDGSFMARLLDISTARSARDEFVSAVLDDTK